MYRAYVGCLHPVLFSLFSTLAVCFLRILLQHSLSCSSLLPMYPVIAIGGGTKSPVYSRLSGNAIGGGYFPPAEP